MITLDQRELTISGFQVWLDAGLGHLMVAHDGTITWDDLQRIKDAVWGQEARAVEVYPRRSDLVNSGNFRHLWRLGDGDFAPDLLKHEIPNVFDDDNLAHRHLAAWSEAEGAFRP